MEFDRIASDPTMFAVVIIGNILIIILGTLFINYVEKVISRAISRLEETGSSNELQEIQFDDEAFVNRIHGRYEQPLVSAPPVKNPMPLQPSIREQFPYAGILNMPRPDVQPHK